MYQYAQLTWIAQFGRDGRRLGMIGLFSVLGSPSPKESEGKSLDAKDESVD